MPSLFFRSPLEDSSSAEETSSVISRQDEQSQRPSPPANNPGLTRVQSLESESTENLSRSLSAAQISPQPIDIKDVALTALLEDKALREAIQFLNERRDLKTQRPLTKHDPEVQILAKEKYMFMFEQFRSNGVVDSNVHRPEFQAVRDNVNKALETATRKHNELLRVRHLEGVTTSSGNAVLHSNGVYPKDSSENQLVVRDPALAHDRSPLFVHPLFNSTAPLEYYAEIGRGGYGRVYKVKNVLDNGFYAVKQIPFSQTRLRRIYNRGVEELDALLKEVRTMQKLDHPHIVRYYSAWVEVKPLDKNAPKRIGNTTTETATDPSRPTQSQSAIFQMSLGDDGIVFGDDSEPAQKLAVPLPEKSRPRRGSHATIDSVSDEFIAPNCIDPNAENSGKSPKSGFKPASEETEEEIETIPRDFIAEPSSRKASQKFTQNGDDTDNEPPPLIEYILNIQMALYPMNLAEYLSANTVVLPDGDYEARHCFHLGVSLKILLAILDGVSYLHSRDLVHRDLKPANIFVAPTKDRYRSKHGIFLGDCKGCQAAGVSNNAQLGIRIGDFGLVTDIAHLEDDVLDARAKVVGTEFYRPPSPSTCPNEKLDVFALGVIAFELLWKFTTGMERFQTLAELKKGHLPSTFAQHVGDERVASLIRYMVSSDEKLRPTCDEVQKELEDIVGSLA
ncbi:kinase-like domain-containing protein [Phyllosticta citriasiana]|uniref:Kinase-like domain-containing protein n=1 Tax=Phyllosticta citriasiana TaxID=595635 RepID=A0ABR1KBG7_9PEZI